MGSFWQEVTESFSHVGPSRVGVNTGKDEQLPRLSPIPSPEGGPSYCWNCRWSAETSHPGFILQRDVFPPRATLDSAPPHLRVLIRLLGRCPLQWGGPHKPGASPRKTRIFPATGMCCTSGCTTHQDALPSGCAAIGMCCTVIGMRFRQDALQIRMCCHQNALPVLVQAEGSGEECWARPACPVS